MFFVLHVFVSHVQPVLTFNSFMGCFMSSSRDSGLSWSCWNDFDLESENCWEFGSSRYREKVGPPSMRIHIQVLFQRETSQIIHWIDMDSLTVKPKQNTRGGTSSPLVSHLWKQHLSTKSWLGVQGLNNFLAQSNTRANHQQGLGMKTFILHSNCHKTQLHKLFRPQFSLHLATTLTRHHLPNKKNQKKIYIHLYTPDSSHHFRLSTPILVALSAKNQVTSLLPPFRWGLTCDVPRRPPPQRRRPPPRPPVSPSPALRRPTAGAADHDTGCSPALPRHLQKGEAWKASVWLLDLSFFLGGRVSNFQLIQRQCLQIPNMYHACVSTSSNTVSMCPELRKIGSGNTRSKWHNYVTL